MSTAWDPGSIPVFLLCGGQGSRLRSVEPGPKSLVPIAGRPFLAHLLRSLSESGFRRFHLLLGVGADAVLAAHSDLTRDLESGVLTWSLEETPLDTGGAIAAARRFAGERTLVVNADSFVACDFAELARVHSTAGVEATLLGVWSENRADYGRLEVGPSGRVGAFAEKGDPSAGWISAGIYLFEGRALDRLPAGRSSLERDLLPALARDGQLAASLQRCYFRDIGTPERLASAREEFVRGTHRRAER